MTISDEDNDDLDEARSTVSSVKTGRKRQLSTSTAASSIRPPAKYQSKNFMFNLVM